MLLLRNNRRLRHACFLGELTVSSISRSIPAKAPVSLRLCPKKCFKGRDECDFLNFILKSVACMCPPTGPAQRFISSNKDPSSRNRTDDPDVSLTGSPVQSGNSAFLLDSGDLHRAPAENQRRRHCRTCRPRETPSATHVSLRQILVPVGTRSRFGRRQDALRQPRFSGSGSRPGKTEMPPPSAAHWRGRQ